MNKRKKRVIELIYSVLRKESKKKKEIWYEKEIKKETLNKSFVARPTDWLAE